MDFLCSGKTGALAQDRLSLGEGGGVDEVSVEQILFVPNWLDGLKIRTLLRWLCL